MTELRPWIFASGLLCLQFNTGGADLRSNNSDTVGSIEILSYGILYFPLTYDHIKSPPWGNLTMFQLQIPLV